MLKEAHLIMDEKNPKYPLYVVTTAAGDRYETKSVSVNQNGTSTFRCLQDGTEYRERIIHVETVNSKPLNLINISGPQSTH